MRDPSKNLSERLRTLRARALASGQRWYQLISVEGCQVETPSVRGEYRTVADALDAARRFGATVCVVREWAGLPGGLRVHVNSVQWLLEWHRVCALRRDASRAGAPCGATQAGPGIPGAPIRRAGP